MADLTDLFGAVGSGGSGGDDELGGLGGLSHRDATTLALVKALQSTSDAGTRRTATPLGSIAQNLIPLFAAPIEARQAEQKSQIGALLLKLKLADALKGDKARDPSLVALDQARTERTKAATQKIQAEMSNPFMAGLTGGDRLYAQALQAQGIEPTAPNILKFKDDQETKRLARVSAEMNTRVENTLEAHDVNAANKLLNSTASDVPEYRNKTIFDKTTGQVIPAEKVSIRALRDRDSPYITLDAKDAGSIRGARQLVQQLDRLDELIPQVLPKKRMYLPITLAQQATEEKPGALATELDRLSAFENLQGTRELTGGQRINQTEIQNVGKIDRHWDNQANAHAKVNAMRQKLAQVVGSYGLDPAAFLGKGAAPSESATPVAAPQQDREASQQQQSKNVNPLEVSKTMTDLTRMKKTPTEIRSILTSLYGPGVLDIDIQ